MTREQEITMAADAASRYESPSFFEAFVTGAEWADRTMLEKACEWLDENMNDVGIRFMRGDEIKDIVDLFHKAMKGE